MRYAIRIAVDDGYLFSVRQSAANSTAGPVTVRPIGLVSRSNESADIVRMLGAIRDLYEARADIAQVDIEASVRAGGLEVHGAVLTPVSAAR